MTTNRGVPENDEAKILWDVAILCGHLKEVSRPDIVVIEMKV